MSIHQLALAETIWEKLWRGGIQNTDALCQSTAFDLQGRFGLTADEVQSVERALADFDLCLLVEDGLKPAIQQRLRPARWLGVYREAYPELWSSFGDARASRNQFKTLWPDWCYCPLGIAQLALYRARHGRNANPTGHIDPMLPTEASNATALAAWRLTKSVYRFHPATLDALWNTPIEGNIPTGTLMRLPDTCLYIELPGLNYDGALLQGVWIHLEYDQSERIELRFTLDTIVDGGNNLLEVTKKFGFWEVASNQEWGVLQPAVLHLDAPTIEECFENTVKFTQSQMASSGVSFDRFFSGADGIDWFGESIVPSIVSLLLYLITTLEESKAAHYTSPKKQNAGKSKGQKSQRDFAAEKEQVTRIGYRTGAAIRGALAHKRFGHSGGSGGSGEKAPHMRRAHWHTFLAGPRELGEARPRKLQWLPPIAVKMSEADLDELPPTVRKVK